MMVTRVWLWAFLSILFFATIKRHVKARNPRAITSEALTFCSGLTGSKNKRCSNFPEMGLSARDGVELALEQCRSQFTDLRWNCSGVTVADVFQTQRMLKAGSKESSFLEAITSAGVAYQVTKGCSQGNWEMCGCDSRVSGVGHKSGEMSWEWGGCSEDYRFGYDYSTKFMDPAKNEKGMPDMVTRHNNEAGRKVIKDNMGKTCRCHGVSGSCTVRVCWRTMPKMAAVSVELRKKYDQALKVKMNKNKSRLLKLMRGRRGKKRNTNSRKPSVSSLVYVENSPEFCNPDGRFGILGTYGRTCNKTSEGTDSCREMCCGRGYNRVHRVKDVKCNCSFIWCCHVKCDWCKMDWIEHTCK
ncbi:protein Wnt-7b-like [Montipora capricornis]|uniref:protein Wnt-7b-like n=1 Tax=Montipora capricornis TaxID=246305 RepID=UPI0035F16B63